MSSNFPIRSGQGAAQGVQTNQAPAKSTTQPATLKPAQYDTDEYSQAAAAGPAGSPNAGRSNPLLSLSVSDALNFLQGVQQGKQIDIAGQTISVRALEQVLSQVLAAGAGDMSVGDALAQIGSQAQAASDVPIQNASVGQAILGLKDIPPNQVVLNTNAPGGGTQSVTAGSLLAILNQVSQSLGSKADNMTVLQALQFVAQASSPTPNSKSKA